MEEQKSKNQINIDNAIKRDKIKSIIKSIIIATIIIIIIVLVVTTYGSNPILPNQTVSEIVTK